MNKETLEDIDFPEPFIDDAMALCKKIAIECNEEQMKTLMIGIASTPEFVKNAIFDVKKDNPFSYDSRTEIRKLAKKVNQWKKGQRENE